MAVPDEKHLPRWWSLAMVGGLAGAIIGFLSGPIVMLASLWLVFGYFLPGTASPPIMGAISGALEGAGLGAVWVFVVKQPRRLTIARLMLVVAISGLYLAFLVANPPVALFALMNGILLLPVMIVVLGTVVRYQEEESI